MNNTAKNTVGEQIGDSRRYINGPWRWWKRRTSRLRRRLGKRLLDKAPRKDRYSEWVA